MSAHRTPVPSWLGEAYSNAEAAVSHLCPGRAEDWPIPSLEHISSAYIINKSMGRIPDLDPENAVLTISPVFPQEKSEHDITPAQLIARFNGSDESDITGWQGLLSRIGRRELNSDGATDLEPEHRWAVRVHSIGADALLGVGLNLKEQRRLIRNRLYHNPEEVQPTLADLIFIYQAVREGHLPEIEGLDGTTTVLSQYNSHTAGGEKLAPALHFDYLGRQEADKAPKINIQLHRDVKRWPPSPPYSTRRGRGGIPRRGPETGPKYLPNLPTGFTQYGEHVRQIDFHGVPVREGASNAGIRTAHFVDAT